MTEFVVAEGSDGAVFKEDYVVGAAGGDFCSRRRKAGLECVGGVVEVGEDGAACVDGEKASWAEFDRDEVGPGGGIFERSDEGAIVEDACGSAAGDGEIE